MTGKSHPHEKFINELKDLLQLDYAAVEAYDSAIERFKNETFKMKFQEFRNDHHRHIKNVTEYLKKIGGDYPTGAGIKKILTQGKVILANLAGDISLLKAMKSNELETTEAYKHINAYPDIPSDIKDALLDGYQDEKRHLLWIEKELDKSW